MPQIAQLSETFSSQIFWLLVFFGLTFLVVGRGMVPRIMATVADRESRIGADLAAAKAARDAADAQEVEWRVRENENRAAAQALVAEAKERAAAEAEQRLKGAQAQFDSEINTAEERIGAARREALAELETVAAEAAQAIVAKLADIEIPRPLAQQAVKEALVHG